MIDRRPMTELGKSQAFHVEPGRTDTPEPEFDLGAGLEAAFPVLYSELGARSGSALLATLLTVAAVSGLLLALTVILG
jgi:hypothetical protein